jgi:hypothetical protein
MSQEELDPFNGPFEDYLKADTVGYVKAVPPTMIDKLKAKRVISDEKCVISDDLDASANMLRFHAWMMGLIQEYSHNIITTSLNQLKGIIQGSVIDEEVDSSYQLVYNEGKEFLQLILESFDNNSYPPSVTDNSNILIIEGIFEKIPEAEVDTHTPPPIHETKVFTALRSILNYSNILKCVKNENDPSLDYLMNPFENYTKVFGSMFCNLLSSQDVHPSSKTWRRLIEHINAGSQCTYAEKRYPSTKSEWEQCYICGEPSASGAYECEHVLYAFLAIGLGVGSGIIQSSNFEQNMLDKEKEPLWYQYEYANAHRCCNQIKSDDNWVTIIYDNSQNQYVISPSDVLIRKTLINIKEGITRKLYDCDSITPFTEKGIQDRVDSIINTRLHRLCEIATEEASRYKSHFIISMRLKQLIALRRTIKTMSESFLRSGQTHPPEEPDAKRQKVELEEKETRIKNADKLLTEAPSLTPRLKIDPDMSGVSLRDTTSYITKKTNELIDFKCKNAFITSFTNDKNGTYTEANNYLVQITTDSTEKEKFEKLLTQIIGNHKQLPAVFTPSSISELFKTVIREDVLEHIGFIDRLIRIYNPPPQDKSSPSSPDTVMIHPSIAKTIIEIVVLEVGYNVFTNFIGCRLSDTEISGNPYLSVVVNQFNRSNILKNTQHYINNLKGNFSRFIESARQNKQLSDNELDKLAQFITYDVNKCKSPSRSPSSSSVLTGGGGDDDQLTLFDEIGERTLSGTLNPDYMVLYLETVYGNRGHVLQTTFDELYQDLLEDKDDDDGFIKDSMDDVIINDIKGGITQISYNIHAKYQQVVEEFIKNKPSNSPNFDSQPAVYGETQSQFESDVGEEYPDSPTIKKPPFEGGSSITRKRRVKHKRIHNSRNKRRVTKHRETIRRSKRRHIHKYSKNKRNRRQRQHV